MDHIHTYTCNEYGGMDGTMLRRGAKYYCLLPFRIQVIRSIWGCDERGLHLHDMKEHGHGVRSLERGWKRLVPWAGGPTGPSESTEPARTG